LTCEPNYAIVPSLAYDSSSKFVPSSVPFLVSSSDDDRGDENTPLPTQLPPYDPTEPEPAPTLPLPRWVCSTLEGIGDLVNDPSYQHWTCYQFQ
jgi:hypothetical protein